MEGVAVASSFAGVISLGITVCHGILQYYDSYKDAEDNVKSMYKSVETLTKTFLVLRRSIGHHGGSPLFNSASVNRVEESICDCEDGISKLETKLAKIKVAKQEGQSRTERAKAQIRRAKYPFTKSTLAKLKQICGELQDDLLLAMETLQM